MIITKTIITIIIVLIKSRNLCAAWRDSSVCEKTTPLEKMAHWNAIFAEQQIRGWRAVSAAGLHGKG